MTIEFQILKKLAEIKNDSEQVAREIYYAISQLPVNHPAEANLKQALMLLGANKPEDVNLSSNALSRNRQNRG